MLLIAGMLPLGLTCLRSDAIEGVVALSLTGVIATLVLLLLAEGFHRQPFVDLAVALAVMSFIGSVAFVRFLEGEL
ncbi:MAG: MrpF/PhaF family protein [Actinomycetota bacterium]|nr:MrpF/PhaF family protein [Actinomycetota bacterium]